MAGQIIPATGAQLQGPIFSNFVNKIRLIQAVDKNVNTTITTTVAHGYYTGMFVRINVPPLYGMSILATTPIVVTSPTTFQTQIDTSQMNTFVSPTLYPPVAFTPAQSIPISFQEMNIAPPPGD